MVEDECTMIESGTTQHTAKKIQKPQIQRKEEVEYEERMIESVATQHTADFATKEIQIQTCQDDNVANARMLPCPVSSSQRRKNSKIHNFQRWILENLNIKELQLDGKL